jgi:hypothetical protein
MMVHSVMMPPNLQVCTGSWALILSPGEFADVHVPVAAVGHAHGFLFLLVDDLGEVHRRGQNIYQHVAGTERDDPGALFLPAEEGKFNEIDGIDVAGDARDAVFVGIHHANEMTVRILLKIAPVNDVNLFAFFQNHAASIAEC